MASACNLLNSIKIVEIVMNKILVVEDEFDLSKVIRKRLSSEGYEVVIAADAYQGVEFAHTSNPDLIILDLMLPGGGGMAVLNGLKKTTTLRFIPTIILTGMNDDEYKKKVIEMGVDAYLEKPYDSVELLSTIAELLD